MKDGFAAAKDRVIELCAEKILLTAREEMRADLIAAGQGVPEDCRDCILDITPKPVYVSKGDIGGDGSVVDDFDVTLSFPDLDSLRANSPDAHALLMDASDIPHPSDVEPQTRYVYPLVSSRVLVESREFDHFISNCVSRDGRVCY